MGVLDYYECIEGAELVMCNDIRLKVIKFNA